MFRKLFKEAGAKDVVTLFHAPSTPSSMRVLSILKQAHGTSVATATEDQASSHETKTDPPEFELDITESAPTSDQLKSILDYLGAGSASKIIKGATGPDDALRKLNSDGSSFIRPLVVDWHKGKAVVGDNESEILSLLRKSKE